MRKVQRPALKQGVGTSVPKWEAPDCFMAKVKIWSAPIGDYGQVFKYTGLA